MQFGSFTLAMDRERLYPEFVMRRFNLTRVTKNESVTRAVTQLHFTTWPDFGVPEEASSMLKFIRHVRSHVTPTQGPIVVHCSAGVGRTGTFIAIDILLQRMQEVGGVVNVQEVVCRMRAQRANMVQTTVSLDIV
jgi:protein tyrosine phosphatase